MGERRKRGVGRSHGRPPELGKPTMLIRRTLFTLASLAMILSNRIMASEETGQPPHDAYIIVLGAAMPILPPPLHRFFESHLSTLEESPFPETGQAKAASTAGQYYIMLDAAAANAGDVEQRAAAQRFPRDRRKAKSLFRNHAIRSGGTLPWAIVDRFQALRLAMRSNDASSVLTETGNLLRLTTAASSPFNTTVNRDGTNAQPLFLKSEIGAEDDGLHRSVRLRFQRGLLRQLRARLQYEVRVSPLRFKPVANPLATVFAALQDSRSHLAAALALDHQIMMSLEITDSESFMDAADAYYERLAEVAASTTEARLEKAALLGARLIGTAWMEAGSPDPASWGNRQPPTASSPDAKETSLMGSVNSKIYHLKTCSHAKRIDSANVVHFSSGKAALGSGRQACKTCRPPAS